jgi:hypothetical protein
MSTGQNLCRVIDVNGNETICLPSSLTTDELAAMDSVKVDEADPSKPKPQRLNEQCEIKNILSK